MIYVSMRVWINFITVLRAALFMLFLPCLSQAQIFIPFSYWKTMFAGLEISESPTYNYGIVPINSNIDKTFTLTNTGATIIDNMNSSGFLSTFSFKGGTYPGTNGTCGVFLTVGSDCTIVVTANAPSAGTRSDYIIINYTDGTGGPYLVRRAITAQFTSTSITSLFVIPASGTFAIGDTYNLKCYGNTSDGGTIELTTACSWSSGNARVSVNDTTNKGLITGVSNGVATTITASYSALSGTSSIVVNPGAPSFPDTGIGLFGRYFTTTSGATSPNDPYSILQNQRIDARVNFNWAAGTNPAGGVNDFSAIWTGQITAPTTGAYCVQSRSDDGARLWIDNTLIVNRWVDQSATTTNGTFTFTADVKYDIIYEFYENGGDAVAQILYVAGACGTGVAVTQARLYPTATRALDLISTTSPRWTNNRRTFTLNGTVGAIANGAAITGTFGGAAPTPVNATASNSNGTGMAYVNTERSQGVNFDGVDDYVSVAANVLPATNSARSIAFWIKPTSTGSDEPITFYGTNVATQGYGVNILSDGKVQHSIIGTECTSTGAITFGSYNHVAVTLTGTTGLIYINGALDSTCTFGATPNTGGGTLYIGTDLTTSNFYEGEIDDIAYWNTVLTAGEVNTLYIRGRVVNPF